MPQDYARLQRADWDKLGPTVLAQELFNILSTAPVTRDETGTSDGWFIKADESGADETYEVTLDAGGSGWSAGEVVSGSASTYRVQIANGPTVTATVPRILQTSNQTIPAGAQAIVIRLSDGTYRLVIAVWVTQTT